MKCIFIFEKELKLRKIPFSRDKKSGIYYLECNGTTLEVCLENLEKRFLLDNNPDIVSEYVDVVVSSVQIPERKISREELYWILEPNDYKNPPMFRFPVSRQVDRVLAHIPSSGEIISWVTEGMLEDMKLSVEEAGAFAFDNLDAQLEQVSVEELNVGEVILVTFGANLPCKSALLLAPNLPATLDKIMECPVLAVIPDRDFLYLWPAKHEDFATRIGGVVTREYSQAPYPLSTEVFKLTDKGIEAVGAFPRQ